MINKIVYFLICSLLLVSCAAFGPKHHNCDCKKHHNQKEAPCKAGKEKCHDHSQCTKKQPPKQIEEQEQR